MALKLWVAGVILFAGSIFSDLPVHDPWFDLFVFSIIMSAATSGMPEPSSRSGDFYVWVYRTMHLIFHMSTAYMTHKSFWPAFEAEEVTPRKIKRDRPKVVISEETALAKNEGKEFDQ